jgi:biopolymer transport protein ExbD
MENRNRSRVAKRRIQSQINITPLIDVLLVLIVIFMVITPVTPTGLDAAIPGQAPSSGATPKPPQDFLVLSVEKDGAITLNHNKVNSMAELTMNLQGIFKTRNDRTVFVQGAKNLDFDVVAHVIDTAIGSGASRIGLLTEEIH